MNVPAHPYQAIQTALSRLRVRLRTYALLKGALALAAVAALAGSAAAVLESYFWMAPAGRVIAAVLLVLLGGVSAFIFIALPLVRAYRPESLALLLEHAHPAFRGLLITAVNLEGKPGRAARFSSGISGAVVARAALQAAALPPQAGTDTVPLRKTMVVTVPVLLGVTVLLLTGRSVLVPAAGRLMHPLTAYARGPLISARVLPGDITVIKGDSLTVRAAFTPVPPEGALLRLRREDRSVWDEFVLAETDTGDFTCVIRDIRKAFMYTVAAPGLPRTDFKVSVADLPAVAALQWMLRPPRYTGLPVREVTDNITRVETMAGSRVTLALTANKPLASAVAVFNDSSRVHAVTDGRTGSINFKALRNRRFKVYLTGQDGTVTREPVSYAVAVLSDTPPRIRITVPGDDVEAPEDMVLPLEAHLWDDFGFSSLVLSYRGGNRDWRTADIPLTGDGRERVVRYGWPLEDAGLLPDETMAYYITVYDNDAVAGYKSAVSKTYHVRNPSIFEMFEDIGKQEDARINELEEAVRRGTELKEQMERVQREMLNEKTVSWERKKELEGMMQRRKEMAQKMEKAAQSLDDTIEKMRQNDMAASETMEKLARIRELMDEVATPEMREAMRKMNEAMNNVSKNELQDALKNFEFSHEKYLEKLDRTLDLLKKMKAERSLDEAIRKADELRERQERINADLDDAKKNDAAGNEKLAEREKRAAADAERMERELDALEEQLREVSPEAADALKKAQEFMREQRLTDTMRQMSGNMQQGNMQQAQQQGEQSEDGLEKTADMLSRAKQQMQQEEKEKMLRDLRAVIMDLLYVSDGQETLQADAKSLSRRSPRYPAVAGEERVILDGMTQVAARILALARNSVFIPTEAGAEIGNAVNRMRSAIRQLEGLNGRRAAEDMVQAVYALDQAVTELRNVEDMLQQMASMSQGSMMEQLKQMAQKQGGINQMTRSLMEMMMGTSGGMSMQGRGQMARMAAEQQALQQQLSGMGDKTGNMQNMLGRLGEMGKEMGEIADELKSGNISERTLQRQERVLDRLLDAQRSVRRQDFSKERKAAAGKDYRRKSPDAAADGGGKDDPWYDDMLRALQEKFPRDYQDLIRAYFQRLAKERREEAR